MKDKKVWFLAGSQDLYGADVLKEVEKHAREMAAYWNAGKDAPVAVEFKAVVRDADGIAREMAAVNAEENVVGVIVWMHTFSPAKMWIRGLSLLQKPLLHVHTQYNERLPYESIDMDFMNLNQAAHGDREFGYVCTRMRLERKVVAGYYRDAEVTAALYAWARAAAALAFSRTLKVCRFGDNMRDVAVTEGDKVEAEKRFGWQVDYYGVGDLAEEIAAVTERETDARMAEYAARYTVATKDLASVREQAKYEIALQRFLARGGYRAFTTNFQDLHGLKQLPGLAVQRLMDAGIGFGGEGDWKTSALDAVLMYMAEGLAGGTAFMEDYTYHLEPGAELVLGAHMLEVSPRVAATKPAIEVHPLGIGGREAPARLVFDGIEGDAAAVTITDMGDRFRMIVAGIELVRQPAPMPKLPVARLMWKLKPDLKTGAAAWIYAGGAHHTVVTSQLRVCDLRDLAAMFGIECIVIDERTELDSFRQQLSLSDALWKLK